MKTGGVMINLINYIMNWWMSKMKKVMKNVQKFLIMQDICLALYVEWYYPILRVMLHTGE